MRINDLIDVNCDLGEYESAYERLKILPYINSANISCGYHAGGNQQIYESIANCILHKIKVGAHPSFDDKKNFGRKEVNHSKEKILNDICTQLDNFIHIAKICNIEVNHIKPHGALYHLVCNNDEYANIFIEALKKFKHKFLLYTLNNSIIETICKKKKINFCSEYFFDRRYDSKRKLINRSEKDALLIDTDKAISQFNNLIDFEELKKNNKRITVCIHMDGKNSINMAKKLREFIDSLDS